MKAGAEKEWYRLITRGMGIIVCAASALLFVYLAKIAITHGMDLGLAGFFLVPIVTFLVGCVFIRISVWKVITLGYKDFNGTVNYNKGKDIYFGRIENIDELIAYEGKTTGEIEAAFREAVDYYIEKNGGNESRES